MATNKRVMKRSVRTTDGGT